MNELNINKTQICLKQEYASELLDNSDFETITSVLAAECSSKEIKDEVHSEEERIPKRPKRRKKDSETNHPHSKKIHKHGKSDRTQLPCIINIMSPSALEQVRQINHTYYSDDGMYDSSDAMYSTSLQSAVSEKTNGLDVLQMPGIADLANLNSTDCTDVSQLPCIVDQANMNTTITSKIYQILVDIQCSLKDLKAEVRENSEKIDQLQKLLFPEAPLPYNWNKEKNEFNFPLSSDEELLEFEKQLENKEKTRKLFLHLTRRAYTSWKEMIVITLRYVLSRDVALLYNLNGIKGSKKKFRDLNICNLLVDCVKAKFHGASSPDILKRISLTLAGAGDWDGARYKKIKEMNNKA